MGNIGHHDEWLAQQLLELFQERAAAGLLGPHGIPLLQVVMTVPGRARIGDVKAVARSRPTEFALLNAKVPGMRRSRQHLACLSVAGNAGPGVDSDEEDDAGQQEDDQWRCRLCDVPFHSATHRQQHLASARHKVLHLMRQLHRSGGSVQANQQGLQVSELPQLQDLQVGEERQLELAITNVGHKQHCLQRTSQLRPLAEVQVRDLGPEWVLPGEQTVVRLAVLPRAYGILCTLLVLDFGGFVIARELRVEACMDDPDLRLLQPAAPYTGPRTSAGRAALLQPLRPFVPGVKPRKARVAWQQPPRDHAVPDRLKRLVAENKVAELQAVLALFNSRRDLRSHLAKLHLLLHLEELQQALDVRRYDLTDVELVRSGRYLALQVAGLAESRPSVLRGDALYVTPADDDRRAYQGFVHVVRLEEVLLRFDPRFHSQFIVKRRYNVRFAVKRTSFVFMHEAVDAAAGDLASTRPELLLPPPDARERECSTSSVRVRSWFDAKLNAEQQTAVVDVLEGTSGRLPYIIWGPPGTGKTSTLVEAAAQLLALNTGARLLLVAPSNNAADLLAQRLLRNGCPKSHLLRVCAFSRPREDLPLDLHDVTPWDETIGAFTLPTLEEVCSSWRRVVVVTALMVGKLRALGVPPRHFTHVLMDEAGHAEEPLALCALAGVVGRDTSVVLAGDPRQLGPIVHSALAKSPAAGLDVSLLERLLSAPPYAAVARGGGTHHAPGLMTKLVCNYRSHPTLLELPSRLFYANDLKACANPELTDNLLHWEGLPNEHAPLLVHSIAGRDEREGNSPSWFNTQECGIVVSYVQRLMQLRRNRVTANQIGVVTPYHKQVQKLRRLFEGKGLSAVQVGSVEQFQGQEKRVIIISTVRSQPAFLDHDFKHKLGFVGNAKRFNVAITRAQALLIVVGNPAVLMRDPHWRELLRHAHNLRATAGQAMPDLWSGEDDDGGGGGGGLSTTVAQLEELMASLVLSGAEARAAAQAAALQQLLDVSALVDEAGAGMTRHDG